MSPRMLLRTGIITFLAGVYLYWSVPIWLRFFGVGPWGEGMVIRPVLYWFCISVTGAGGLLFFRGLLAFISARREAAQLIK
jgi:hypothetical protein